MPVESKTPKPGIEAASLTDVGLHRANNEDSYLYWEPDSDADFRRKGRLAIVADGMGGYEGGQEASRLAVETVRHVYDRDFTADAARPWLLPSNPLTTPFSATPSNILSFMVWAPPAPRSPSSTASSASPTSATAVSTLFAVAPSHSPDSRSFLRRTAGRERHRSLRRCRVPSSAPHPDCRPRIWARYYSLTFPEQPVSLEEADTLILCTDGLWGLVGDTELARIVA